MSMKSILGSLSPIYGAVTGEGMMGKMLNPDDAAKIAEKENARKRAEASAMENAALQANSDRQNSIAAAAAKSMNVGMKKGGKVSSASSRADGIAQRGKTRGKIV